MRFNLRKRIVPFQIPPYRRRNISSLVVVGIFLAGLILSFYFIDFRIRPTLIQLAEAKARQIATQAINQAIRSNISPDIHYQNLMKLQLKEDGKIALIQPNTGEINRISAEATLAVQNQLKDLPKVTIKVPIGQVLGSRILAGFGPDIPLQVLPIGVVESTINDRFDTAGINQTRHRIFITIKAVVKMVVPLVNQEIQVSTDIPLMETVIVGDVPNVYLGQGSGIILPGITGGK
jgi:sporulation protein YunB